MFFNFQKYLRIQALAPFTVRYFHYENAYLFFLDVKVCGLFHYFSFLLEKNRWKMSIAENAKVAPCAQYFIPHSRWKDDGSGNTILFMEHYVLPRFNPIVRSGLPLLVTKWSVATLGIWSLSKVAVYFRWTVSFTNWKVWPIHSTVQISRNAADWNWEDHKLKEALNNSYRDPLSNMSLWKRIYNRIQDESPPRLS